MSDIYYSCLLSDADKRLPVYVTTAGEWSHQEPVQRPEGFPSYQLLLSVSGEGVLEVDDQTLPVKTGQVIFLYPGVPHGYEAVREPWGLMFVSLAGSLCGPLLEQAGIVKSGVFPIKDLLAMRSGLFKILTEARSEGAYSGAECSKLMYSLLLDLPRYVQTSQHDYHQQVERLQPVIRYIRQHCHLPLTIELLAKQIGITPQYLCLLFKKTLNVRPMEYVNRERINLSKELMLLEPGLKIGAIAKRTGFDHPSYFCTVFKRLEGLTPEAFKKVHGH